VNVSLVVGRFPNLVCHAKDVSKRVGEAGWIGGRGNAKLREGGEGRGGEGKVCAADVLTCSVQALGRAAGEVECLWTGATLKGVVVFVEMQ
jgi:hypothetical protein